MSDSELDPNEIEAILKQSEIERLMMEASLKGGLVVLDPEGVRYPDPEAVNIENYDFKNPVYLTEGELRQIRLRHEQCVHYLAARLSMFLRLDFSVKLSHLHTVQYEKFVHSISSPAFISLFKVEGLKGTGVLNVNTRLAMTIVDRLLGGKGHSIREDRALTEIEITLMDEVLKIVLEEWCREWEDIQELNASIVGRENTGRFLRTSEPETVVVVLNLEASVGDCTEHIQIAVPYVTMEPVIKRMQAVTKAQMHQENMRESGHWVMAYDEVSVPITAEWEAFDFSVEDLMNLRPGDILELPKASVSSTNVRVSNVVRFKGEIGMKDEHVAIRITESVDV